MTPDTESSPAAAPGAYSAIFDSTAGISQTLKLGAPDQRARHELKDLTMSQLQRMVDEFDLGRIVRMEEPLTTQCNVTDPFSTGRGTFLIRIRHGEDFGERVEFLHEMMDFLRKKGLPVAEVMRRPDGRSWTLWGDRIVEIHRFIRHDAGVHRDWRRMNAAATLLGDLHAALADFRPEKMPVGPEMRNDVSPMQCWNLMPTAERRLADADLPDDELRDAHDMLCRIRGLLPPLIDDYERILGAMPWMFIHGDYHFWNILYRGDDVAGLVDFDFLQERERIFDLAYAMQAVVGYLGSVEARGSDNVASMRWSNLRLWLDHYDSVTHLPLSEQERKRLPMEMVRIYLVNLVVGLTQEDPMEALSHAAADLPVYEWISQQHGMFL